MAGKRLKQLLMGIGLMTVLGVLAMVGLVAYLWWDAETTAAEVEADFDGDDGFDVDADLDGAEHDTDAEVAE